MMREIWLRLLIIYGDGQLAVKFITVPVYLILAGAAVSYANNSNGTSPSMNFLGEIAHLYIWTLIFLFPMLMRIRALIFGLGSHFTRMLTPSYGMMIWVLMLLGNLLSENFDPTATLYTIPLTLELWLLSRAIDERVTHHAA